MDLQKMRDWFDSEEGQKSIADFADKINREEEIKFNAKSQIEYKRLLDEQEENLDNYYGN